MKWFGATWGAPICNPAHHVDTPIGQACAGCNAPIGAESWGVVVPHVGAEGHVSEWAYHRRCWMIALGFAPPHDAGKCHLPPGHEGECEAWAGRINRPVVRLLASAQPLSEEGKEAGKHWLQCPSCPGGFLTMQRDLRSFRFLRYDRCTRCGQQYYYTDHFLRGEFPHVPEGDRS